MLSVELDSIFNQHFMVYLPVTVNQPFRVETTNGKVTNIISGTVSGPVQGKYSLPLYVSEGGGFVSAFVYIHTVLLSNAAP